MNDANVSAGGTPKAAAPRYVMIGGFLGAGKTTAVANLARHLTGQGLRVGLITNDQGNALVDTALLVNRGFAVQEIAGGCFCCRFNSLMDAASKLSSQTCPDVFVAEPVGSCTDLVATVTYPLRRLYGDRYVIAPLSVLIDPIRALRIFGRASGGNFSEKVRYIYRKQLEEADLIVINKCDLLSDAQLQELRSLLQRDFPQAALFTVSARDGTGLEEWFAHLATATQLTRPVMAVDYDQYAEGEALLGWLNATITLESQTAFNANRLLQQLCQRLQSELTRRQAEIAHLKMTLDPADGLAGLAVINLVRNDFVPELSQELPEKLYYGQLIVNLRAEAPPAQLQAALEEALRALTQATPGVRLALEHLEAFQPGRPQPTHRVTA